MRRQIIVDLQVIFEEANTENFNCQKQCVHNG